VCGVDVRWSELFAGSGARRVVLPTYAFQRERYWIEGSIGAGDAASIGQSSADHPLLGAAVSLAGDRGCLFTARLSLEAHPWLADHAVMGTVLLPGTAFLELALTAGSQVGCERVEDLTLEVPLLLPERGGVQLQLSVGELEESGVRSLGIYSRSDDASSENSLSEGRWTRHASGTLAPGGALVGGSPQTDRRAGDPSGGSWPPADARPVDLDDLYDRLAALGLEYGPRFQGLQAAWQRGEEVFAEIVLDEDQREHARSYGIHPALLDCALHASMVSHIYADLESDKDRQHPHIPFCFSGVDLHTTGASALRITLSRLSVEEISLTATNEHGEIIATIDSLTTRELSPAQLNAIHGIYNESLYHVNWSTINRNALSRDASTNDFIIIGAQDNIFTNNLTNTGRAIETHPNLDGLGSALNDVNVIPKTVLLDCSTGNDFHILDGSAAEDVVGAAREATHRVLGLLQAWLADERFSAWRLVAVTRRAVAVHQEEDVSCLSGAAVWGLVRSAQSENPGRFVLLDIDEEELSLGVLGAALALDEPQLGVRDGEVLVPRLERLGSGGTVPERTLGTPSPIDSRGTVLVTGGTGGLGALVARHLVSEHGVRSLMLASRRGSKADGALELEAELVGLGAQVVVAACDVSDREQLAMLLESVPEAHPLDMVVHAAGVLEDGLIESLTTEHIDLVMAPKVNGAWHLHELTEHAGLSEFILFSSAAATVGTPGQGNYAAANGFLDALAAHRRARGLPCRSLAWGMWDEASEMTGGLSEGDRRRIDRIGIASLTRRQGLELFDLARGIDQPLLLPMRLDMTALRAEAKIGVLPALMRSLVRLQARGTGGSLAKRLAAAPESERYAVVLALVKEHLAVVLGHASGEAIDGTRNFLEWGLDSLGALELRNRLNVATALRLPAILAIDYPTAAALAGYILNEIFSDPSDANGLFERLCLNDR
jgi:NAD(P)-dependent dehydrogenase (short-subunit alcohol dehydrogenase family)